MKKLVLGKCCNLFGLFVFFLFNERCIRARCKKNAELGASHCYNIPLEKALTSLCFSLLGQLLCPSQLFKIDLGFGCRSEGRLLINLSPRAWLLLITFSKPCCWVFRGWAFPWDGRGESSPWGKDFSGTVTRCWWFDSRQDLAVSPLQTLAALTYLGIVCLFFKDSGEVWKTRAVITDHAMPSLLIHQAENMSSVIPSSKNTCIYWPVSNGFDRGEGV